MTVCSRRVAAATGQVLSALPAVRTRSAAAPSLPGLLLLAASLLLGGCAIVDKPARPAVYDFGPGLLAGATTTTTQTLGVVMLPEVETGMALESTAVLYRLAYADAQQLQPYAQARWSMAPAQLLRQQLRETLGQRATVLAPGDGMVSSGTPPLVLRIDLEEFSQVFEAPNRSVGLVRLRATAVRSQAGGDRVLGQRSFAVQRPAPTPDAPGGVRALTAATQAAVDELQQWLTQLP